MPAPAPKAVGDALWRPVATTAEDGAGLHQHRMLTARTITLYDQALAELRLDVFTRNAGVIGIGHRITGR